MIDLTKVTLAPPMVITEESPEDDYTPPQKVTKGMNEVIYFMLDAGGACYAFVDCPQRTGAKEEEWGRLSFEDFYGDLNYAIELELPDSIPDYGFYKMEGAEINDTYDSYNREHDYDFYPGEITPVTFQEVKSIFGEKLSIQHFIDQFKACWWKARHMEKV